MPKREEKYDLISTLNLMNGENKVNAVSNTEVLFQCTAACAVHNVKNQVEKLEHH